MLFQREVLVSFFWRVSKRLTAYFKLLSVLSVVALRTITTWNEKAARRLSARATQKEGKYSRVLREL